MMKLLWMPDVIRGRLIWLRNRVRTIYRRHKLKTKLRSSASKKIVIGSSGKSFPDWIPTERSELDLIKESTWQVFFAERSINALLAEHVWEHLTPEESVTAVENCFKYLKPGGRVRVAVPDGNHPDLSYIASVKPGGSGPGADDHKVLYTHGALEKLFESAGFSVTLLEYFDTDGEFHYSDWDPVDGYIERSVRFDVRNVMNPRAYTSIIIDAFKPVSQ